MNLWIIFLTGLTTGGLSCLAMQGGLLASVIVNQKSSTASDDVQGRFGISWLPVALFLLAKLVAHTLFGGLLGGLGSVLSLSLEVKLIFQLLTAGFMLATALNMLQVHPIFRFVVFQPPKFLTKIVRNSSKKSSFFAPAVLGVFTIFVPCGITQAMEVLAINSGHPITGALILFSFVIGTFPLFAVLGIATSKMSNQLSDHFRKVGAGLLIAMAIYAINGVLLVIDAPVTLQKLTKPVSYFFSEERFSTASTPTTQNGIQAVQIEVQNNGYSPDFFRVKSGVPVALTLTSHEVYTCALAFVFKEFGINTFLKASDTKTFTFTPTKKGRFTYSCSMGMYSGVMEVM
jgi:sulfite exporter TauE/SafE/plastocyanin